MRIISALLILAGGVGVTAWVLRILEGDMNFAFAGLALFAGLFALGFLGVHYRKVSHKGGAPFIIGAILMVIGFVKLIAEVEYYGIGNFKVDMLVSVILIAIGIGLFRSGQKVHDSQNRFKEPQ